MNFFKPEDLHIFGIIDEMRKDVAAALNAKLKREGKVVYSLRQSNWTDPKAKNDQWKALLINIEPIEKCKHEKNKVRITKLILQDDTEWHCECGAKVKPTNFEAVE